MEETLRTYTQMSHYLYTVIYKISYDEIGRVDKYPVKLIYL